MKNFSANQNYIRFSVLSPLEKSLSYSQIYVFLKRVCIEYPGFSKWYKDLFFSNKELQNGREIIICEKDYRMAGVAILKSAKTKKKFAPCAWPALFKDKE